MAQNAEPGLPKATSAFEGYPVLKASQFLQPAVLKGRNHTVLESVPTQGFANQYTISTAWGTFTVRGNHQLLKRIHEFDAIAQLESVSKSNEFRQALGAAAAKPIQMAGNTLKNPVGTVKNVASGAGKFLRNVGEAVDRGGRKSANTDNALEGLIGYSKVKRRIASQLDVDPYTDNPVLQRRLDSVARASFAGGFVIKAGMLAVTGGAGKTVGALNISADLSNLLRDNPPLALSAINRKKLIGIGISEATAKAFVEHPNITPTKQTLITAQLERLGPVEGNETFLKMALKTEDAADASFFLATASMMAVYHEHVSPVKKVLDLHGIPAIHAANNALVVPLSVDYGSWSEGLDRLSQAIVNYKSKVEISQKMLYVSGIVSPRARKELEARGFVVSDRASTAVFK